MCIPPQLDWNSLRVSNDPDIRELGVQFEFYGKEYCRFGPCEYAYVGRLDLAKIRPVRAWCFYWAPCEAAFRRLVFKENVFCTEPADPPPHELLLAPGCLGYNAIFAEARSGRFRYHLTKMPRENSAGFPDASITVERLTYYFRAEKGLDPAEAVYAVSLDTADHWKARSGPVTSRREFEHL
jgi:hypothetical protein